MVAAKTPSEVIAEKQRAADRRLKAGTASVRAARERQFKPVIQRTGNARNDLEKAENEATEQWQQHIDLHDGWHVDVYKAWVYRISAGVEQGHAMFFLSKDEALELIEAADHSPEMLRNTIERIRQWQAGADERDALAKARPIPSEDFKRAMGFWETGEPPLPGGQDRGAR